ncbi:MAG: hypothetical protein CVU85_00915 [Firmicutes bacterium HGW-Firmicutes-10]|nr:MAG: hypothetical protein CVU85_00915 [Firmicutes bacterium HGW-Firmicutes-10]
MKILKILILIVILTVTVYGCQKTDDSEQIMSDLLSHKTINHFRFVSKDIIEKNREETGQLLLVEYDVTLSTESVTIIGVSTLMYAKDNGKLTLQQNDLVLHQVIPLKAVDVEVVKSSLAYTRGTGIYSNLRETFVPTENKSELTKVSDTQYEIAMSEKYQDGTYAYDIEQFFTATFDLVRGWEVVRKGYVFSEVMNWSGVYDIIFDIAKEDPENYKSNEYSVDEVIRVTIDGKVEKVASVEYDSNSNPEFKWDKNIDQVFVSFERNGKSYRVKSTLEQGIEFFADRFSDAKTLYIKYESGQTKQLYIKYGKVYKGSQIGFSAFGQIVPIADYDFPASMIKISD